MKGTLLSGGFSCSNATAQKLLNQTFVSGCWFQRSNFYKWILPVHVKADSKVL